MDIIVVNANGHQQMDPTIILFAAILQNKNVNQEK